ncbi:class I SAM-dependent methyltransferase [Catenovulum agarivorans]|uniref:class I SAM-dependent methyltransferase n=1 Tax=Catenovulum agarivorans TaxID=1172192 RepID=UPI0002D8654F|nr:class I SAM-dependent methyltransferase [Catenovulum agarivorans]
MKIQQLVKQPLRFAQSKYYQHQLPNAELGGKAWLIGSELKYGGIQTGVPRIKVSPHDKRSKVQLQKGGMIGGDRMLHHGYASMYAKYLKNYLGRDNLLLVEIGILKGNGLAMWCDLFKSARIMGFDIDLSHTLNNMDNLKALGAFKSKQPELNEFDQYADNQAYLASLLDGQKINICIDDGCHTDEAILQTLHSVLPHLADDAVYIIEDNRYAHIKIAEQFPMFEIAHKGQLTVLTFKKAN